MSRTTKTNPWWVGSWWEPSHRYGCPHRLHTSWQKPVTKWIGCDLPDEPPRRKLTPPHRWRALRGPGHCIWDPCGPWYYGREGRKHYGRTSRVGYGANRFERGVRAAWRDCAQGLRYTPLDDIDDVTLPDPRHRHFAIWDEW